MRYRRLAAALVLAAPSISFAWGPEGHQVVALIAYAHLTPEAKAATKALLGDGRDIYDAEVADWADVIRQGHKELGPYHYVDADVQARAIDLKKDGDGGVNVVEGLANQIAFLGGDAKAKQIVLGDADGDGKSPDKTETRAQALRWVVHLCGDIVQPLHCCDRNQDQGGNKLKATLPGATKDTNLHAVWDSGLLRTYVNNYLTTHRTSGPRVKEPGTNKEVPDITDYAMSLDAKISPADRKSWAVGTPLDWANESHQVGVREVYSDLPRGDPLPLDARYIARKQAIVERQLEKGGVRLAAVLNKAFEPVATTRPAR